MAETWKELSELLDDIAVPADFMDSRPLNVLTQEKGVFDDELAQSEAD